MTISRIHMNLYVGIDVWEKVNKNRKQYSPQGGMSTVQATTCKAGRGEQGDVSPAISARTRGPHLDLGRFASTPCLNLTSRLLGRHGHHYPPCIYLGSTWYALTTISLEAARVVRPRCNAGRQMYNTHSMVIACTAARSPQTVDNTAILAVVFQRLRTPVNIEKKKREMAELYKKMKKNRESYENEQ